MAWDPPSRRKKNVPSFGGWAISLLRGWGNKGEVYSPGRRGVMKSPDSKINEPEKPNLHYLESNVIPVVIFQI
jgi:hypothetical protein